MIIAFFSMNATAQSKLGVGFKIGPSFCNQVTTGEGRNVETQNLTGIHLGIYGNYFILEPLAVQLELHYSQRGSKWSDLQFSGKDKLGYIDIPILIRYQIIEYLNVHVGPNFGFLVSAKQIPDEGEKLDVKEYYNSTDIGLGMGLEGNLPYNINLTLRYVLGLGDATTEVEYWEGWKNNAFQISVGYRFMGK